MVWVRASVFDKPPITSHGRSSPGWPGLSPGLKALSGSHPTALIRRVQRDPCGCGDRDVEGRCWAGREAAGHRLPARPSPCSAHRARAPGMSFLHTGLSRAPLSGHPWSQAPKDAPPRPWCLMPRARAVVFWFTNTSFFVLRSVSCLLSPQGSVSSPQPGLAASSPRSPQSGLVLLFQDSPFPLVSYCSLFLSYYFPLLFLLLSHCY